MVGQIYQLPTQVVGQVQLAPNFKYMVTGDSLGTVLSAGYLNQIDLQSNPIGTSDVLQVLYSYNPQTNVGTFGQFSVSLSNGVITLAPVGTASSIASVTLTAAQIDGMYATPVQVIPAPGAGYVTVVRGITWDVIYGSAAFAGGGLVTLQYGSGAHAGGVVTTTGIAAASVTGIAANSVLTDTAIPVVATSANTVNTAIYISNATAAFTAGTGATSTLYVFYSILPAS